MERLQQLIFWQGALRMASLTWTLVTLITDLLTIMVTSPAAKNTNVESRIFSWGSVTEKDFWYQEIDYVNPTLRCFARRNTSTKGNETRVNQKS